MEPKELLNSTTQDFVLISKNLQFDCHVTIFINNLNI